MTRPSSPLPHRRLLVLAACGVSVLLVAWLLFSGIEGEAGIGPTDPRRHWLMAPNRLLPALAVMVICLLFLAAIDRRRGTQPAAVLRADSHPLQLAPEQMAHLLEFSDDVLWLMDLEGDRVYTSPAVTRLRGYTPEEVAELPLEQNFATGSAALFHEMLRQARLSQGHPLPARQMEMLRKDGSTVWCEISAYVLPGTEDQPGYLVGVVRDISERKRAENRLKEREALLSSIFRNSPCGISLTRVADGRLLDANQAWLTMFGLSREEAVGHTSGELDRWVMPEERQRILEAMKTQGYVRNAEACFRHASDQTFDALVSAESVRIGDTEYFVGITSDISEYKHLNTQRLSAQHERATQAEFREQAKTRFLAAASHDLRQPVQAARLFLDLLGKSSLNERQQQLCRQIGTAVESLGSLLDCLLDITRIDAGGMAIRMRDVEVMEIMAQINEEFASLALARGLRFKLFFPQAAQVRTDPQLLNMILRNLVGNALKYTQRGGLLVSVRYRQDRVVLQVWDTGIGIAPEHQERIFEEFYQIDNPHRDNAQGLGLGLPICQRLARLLDTGLSYRSCPGRGSVFELTLPRVR
ncbi:hypothetical protein B9N43_13395 [Denitratisoma sp. DHT3]|uniref:PAS domain-containing sensor histidine kinase n=1 Tax=Denitratisoma sp. DHT3 TaxID=1981880 RepID=UPI00119832B1|nr:PAS domain S-box protein [Denitratisoma sp. DHT3]QDX82149.1 hypothetical protein B9N43_13395 [Denitratisoma sp. DHT3]